jgi:hypothetical protein
VIAAAPLTNSQARELGRKRRHSPEEQAQLARHALANRWGLGAADPTTAVLEADRKGRSRAHRFGWIWRSLEGRKLVSHHDHRRREQLAPDGHGWAPDLVRELLGHKVAAADALGLPAWLDRADRGEWFTAADPELIRLQVTVIACRGDLAQALGVSPGKRAITTLRNLLALAGYRLEAKRSRGTDGNCWRYRVIAEALPEGVEPAQLEAAWREQLSHPGEA